MNDDELIGGFLVIMVTLIIGIATGILVSDSNDTPTIYQGTLAVNPSATTANVIFTLSNKPSVTFSCHIDLSTLNGQEEAYNFSSLTAGTHIIISSYLGSCTLIQPAR